MFLKVQTTEDLVRRFLDRQQNKKRKENIVSLESYDAIAYLYDALAIHQDWQAPAHVVSRILPAICAYQHPIRVIDVGCGTGLATALLRRESRRLNYPPLHVTGLDCSSKMLRESAGKAVYDDLICEDIRNMISLSSCHIIIASGLFETGLCGRQNISSVLNILKPLGAASISITAEEFESDTQAYLSAFRRAKCEVVSHVKLPYRHDQADAVSTAHYFVLRKQYVF